VRKIDIATLGPADHRFLRDLNEVMVLNVIREKQPISRIEIADLTGLEGGTISRIVARLVSENLVYEEGTADASPQGGRKRRFLHIQPRKALAVGVDLRPSGCTVAVSDFTGRILRSTELNSYPDPRKEARSIARSIRKLLQSFAEESFAGIGVSLVGLVDPEQGRILAGEALGWGEDVPIGAMLREAIDIDIPLYFDNGSWLAALAEIWFGKHPRHPRDLVFMDIGEGIGAGIIIRGQLYHGALHGAGEFGHISLDPDGPTCSCGSRGCLEAFAADPATVRRYRETSGAEAGIEAVVARALRGEPAAVAAVQETAAYLGRGLLPVMYALNPEVIVLGGAITRAWDLLYEAVIRELAQRASRFYLDTVRIVPTTLSARPSLVGAIALVLTRSFAVPILSPASEDAL
jgi:predicted NBD/HSP70 family sugar kinase